jgi:hypothetical protein
LGLFDASFDSIHAPTSGVYLKGVRYRRTPATRHAIDGVMIGGDYQIRYRVPTSGTLFIERNTEDFRVSYMDGSTQKTLYQHEYNFAEPLYLYIFTSSDNESSWQVALDNLSYTAPRFRSHSAITRSAK